VFRWVLCSLFAVCSRLAVSGVLLVGCVLSSPTMHTSRDACGKNHRERGAYTSRVWVLAYCFTLLCPVLGQAEDPLAKLLVLALAPLEGRAVVQGPDGTMALVRPGDQLQGSSATLVQVLPDKLVLEEHSTSAGQAPVKRLVWLYKAPREGGPSRLLRLQHDVPANEHPLLPTLQALPGPP